MIVGPAPAHREERDMSIASTFGVIGRRACAVLAAGSAGLHAVMLGDAANIAVGVVMAGMIVGCLYCARDLWLRGTLGVWCVVALMNLAMIAIHVPLPAHHHVAGMVVAGHQPPIMAAATVISLVEAAAAAAVLYYRTRGRLVALSGTPAR
jgi:hypothetical protein